jgi:NAD(P)-dependent dehydrogenase (short-subunit alcohol dehydrogenase family)
VRLQDKIAVITGGARGIGRAIAEGYAGEGARVCLADLDHAEAQKAAREIGCGTFAVQLDVTQRGSIDAMVAEVEQQAGDIDILVNNAAIIVLGA